MLTETLPQRVLIDLMDTARRAEENARRQHDLIAEELGIERVRVNDVEKGDLVLFADERRQGLRHLLRSDMFMREESVDFLFKVI